MPRAHDYAVAKGGRKCKKWARHTRTVQKARAINVAEKREAQALGSKWVAADNQLSLGKPSKGLCGKAQTKPKANARDVPHASLMGTGTQARQCTPRQAMFPRRQPKLAGPKEQKSPILAVPCYSLDLRVRCWWAYHPTPTNFLGPPSNLSRYGLEPKWLRTMRKKLTTLRCLRCVRNPLRGLAWSMCKN